MPDLKGTLDYIGFRKCGSIFGVLLVSHQDYTESENENMLIQLPMC